MIKRETDVERLKRVNVENLKAEIIQKIKKTYDGLTTSQIEYLAGMGAACGATIITYPINKIIFRQSLWGFDFDKAFQQIRIEGISKLFRGCLPPLITKSLNASIMFGTYNYYYNIIRDSFIAKNIHGDRTILMKFVAGMASGSTEAILMPLERIQMLLQDGRLNNRYRNTIHVIAALRKHGLREYYRGVSAVLLRNGPTTFLYFGLKDPLKEYLAGYSLEELSSGKFHRITEAREFAAQFASGAILGATISTLIFPLNVIRIHMQTQNVGSPHQGVWRTFRRLYVDEHSRKKLYAGIHMNALRSVLYWGCVTVFSESLRQYFNQ